MSPTRNDSETDWNKYIARRNNEGNNDAVRRIIIDIIIHSNRSIFFFFPSSQLPEERVELFLSQLLLYALVPTRRSDEDG